MSDRALLDANVLVYAAFPNAPQHADAVRLCGDVLAGRVDACVASQVLLEFFSTSTNPKRVSPARSADDAWVEVEKYRSVLPVLVPPHDVVDRVAALAGPLGITAQRVYDVQLAATMLAHGVSRIYTYDPAVFSHIQGITVLTP